MSNFYYKLITSKLLNLSVGGYLYSNSTVLFDFYLLVSFFVCLFFTRQGFSL